MRPNLGPTTSASNHGTWEYGNTGGNHIKYCGSCNYRTTEAHKCSICGASYGNKGSFTHGTHKCACGMIWTRY